MFDSLLDMMLLHSLLLLRRSLELDVCLRLVAIALLALAGSFAGAWPLKGLFSEPPGSPNVHIDDARGEETCEPDDDGEPKHAIVAEVCTDEPAFEDIVVEMCTDEPAFEDTVMSFALLDDLELGGTYRDADHMPSDPRTDTGVEAILDDGGEGEGIEVEVVDMPKIEAALIA